VQQVYEDGSDAKPVQNPTAASRDCESVSKSLRALDAQKVQKRYNITEVVALETSITDALPQLSDTAPRSSSFTRRRKT
jgi:hypothetical protein